MLEEILFVFVVICVVREHKNLVDKFAHIYYVYKILILIWICENVCRLKGVSCLCSWIHFTLY